MVSKIHFNQINNQPGFTIVELMVSVAVMMLLFGALVLIFNPSEYLKRSRDQKRMSDLTVLDRAISEFKVDSGTLPDQEDILRTSTSLPTGATDLSNAANGWINADLSTYTTKLPIDPLNDTTYFYRYTHNGDTYELNATMELNYDKSSTDGGNESTVYELGDELTLISP